MTHNDAHGGKDYVPELGEDSAALSAWRNCGFLSLSLNREILFIQRPGVFFDMSPSTVHVQEVWSIWVYRRVV